MTPESSRPVTHRYQDPLEAVWLAAARRLGLEVRRSKDVYASTDGRGHLDLGTPESLDADDCVAQMVLHELCHALVEGPGAERLPDWGLDNQTYRDRDREHACLRVQAALLSPFGLAEVLAPTTEYRAYYDAVAGHPLEPRGDPAVRLARRALGRARRAPFAEVLERALAATRRITEAVVEHGTLPDDGGRAPSLFVRLQPGAARHPLGPFVASEGRCGACAYRDPATGLCWQLEAPTDPSWPACELGDPGPLDCAECGACCAEGFDVVDVEPGSQLLGLAPEALVRRPDRVEVPRPGGRCVLLLPDPPPYRCRHYAARPLGCRELEPGGPGCLAARARVGLAR